MIEPNPTSKIELSAGGITLILRRLTEDGYPREQIEVTGVSFSAYGTPATDGTSYEPKCIWNLVALLLPEDAEKLARLAVLSRTQNLLLVDRTDRVWEPVQTRAIAPEDVAIAVEGMIGYYAQFYARITQPIKYSKSGAYRQAQIQLTETAKVPIA